VLAGEHWKKCGIVEWIPMGGNMLWFRDASPVLAGDDVGSGAGPLRIQVPVTIVQRTKLPNTLRYTKDKGYDVRPGDVVSVARGPDYQSTGVVQSVDVPNARLTFLSDSDHSLVSIKHIDSYISDLPQIDVPITFVIKKSNVSLDSFNKIIGHEVFIVGGDRKGYRATLHDVASDTCTVAVHGQARTTLRRQDVVTR
jgi:ribosomal protein L24